MIFPCETVAVPVALCRSRTADCRSPDKHRGKLFLQLWLFVYQLLIDDGFPWPLFSKKVSCAKAVGALKTQEPRRFYSKGWFPALPCGSLLSPASTDTEHFPLWFLNPQPCFTLLGHTDSSPLSWFVNISLWGKTWYPSAVQPCSELLIPTNPAKPARLL